MLDGLLACLLSVRAERAIAWLCLLHSGMLSLWWW